MTAQAQRIAVLERQVLELAEKLEEYRLKAAMVRSFEDIWADTTSGGYPRAPLPDAAFDPEAARKFGEARRANLDRSRQPAYRSGRRGRPRHLRAVDGGAS